MMTGFEDNEYGFSSLHLAVVEGNVDNESLNHHLDHINSNDNYLGQSPLHLAVKLNDFNTVKLLVSHGAKLDVLDRNCLTPLQNIILLNDDNSGNLFLSEQILDSEERENFLKVARANLIVSGKYSVDDCPFENIPERSVINSLLRSISDIDISGDKKELFTNILQSIKEERSLIVEENRKMEAISLPYNVHDAYVIVNYENDVATHFSYCDGNYNDDKTCVVLSYEFDHEKLNALTSLRSLREVIHDVFHNEEDGVIYGEFLGGSADNLRNAISKLAICDQKGDPVIINDVDVGKAQKKGNCVFKSLNIVTKIMLEELGGRKEDYKEYQHALIHGAMNDLLDLSAPKNASKIFFPSLLASLKDIVFLQAIKKGNIHLLDQLSEIFQRQEIDLNDIKSKDSGSGAMFFAKESKNPEVVNWCIRHGLREEIEIEEDDELDITRRGILRKPQASTMIENFIEGRM